MTSPTPAHDIRIVGYEPRWRDAFAALNIEWLEHWFAVEDYDRVVLGNPEQYILADGGHILFAIDGGERVLGTVALKREGEGVYELTKMAVSPEARGRGVGRLLMDAVLDLYRTLDAHELFLESSDVLGPALALYESAGFRRHPAPRPGSHYARADVHMIWEP